ncbi:MAG: 7-cyano-7-deazaguanine synthase QueC [Phycisphaerae bacterium]|nr:7-cyano-7-deazaguanine synthase QueC [Phycisphaerae bacterium]
MNSGSSGRKGKAAVVLLSGGLDSATTAAIAIEQGFTVHALSVAYGQRHKTELDAAKRVAASMGVERHLIQTIDLRMFGGSALTDDIAVPKRVDEAGIGGRIPVTYVPARNTILLALALAFAEVSRAGDIFIGVNALDYSGYPDCRPEFLEAFGRLAALATRAGVEGWPTRIQAPLLNMTKAQIIREGIRLGVDYSLTQSCYDPAPDGAACGSCESCLLRRRGFQEAGVPDPTRYT